MCLLNLQFAKVLIFFSPVSLYILLLFLLDIFIAIVVGLMYTMCYNRRWYLALGYSYHVGKFWPTHQVCQAHSFKIFLTQSFCEQLRTCGPARPPPQSLATTSQLELGVRVGLGTGVGEWHCNWVNVLHDNFLLLNSGSKYQRRSWFCQQGGMVIVNQLTT